MPCRVPTLAFNSRLAFRQSYILKHWQFLEFVSKMRPFWKVWNFARANQTCDGNGLIVNSTATPFCYLSHTHRAYSKEFLELHTAHSPSFFLSLPFIPFSPTVIVHCVTVLIVAFAVTCRFMRANSVVRWVNPSTNSQNVWSRVVPATHLIP